MKLRGHLAAINIHEGLRYVPVMSELSADRPEERSAHFLRGSRCNFYGGYWCQGTSVREQPVIS